MENLCDHRTGITAPVLSVPQVYLTASTVYGLEGQLTSLEDAARQISSVTAESELAELEDQVATAAAQVHHAELQVRMAAPRHSLLHAAFPQASLPSVHTSLQYSPVLQQTLSPRICDCVTGAEQSTAEMFCSAQPDVLYLFLPPACFQTGVQQRVTVVLFLLLAPIEIVWCAVMHEAVV